MNDRFRFRAIDNRDWVDKDKKGKIYYDAQDAYDYAGGEPEIPVTCFSDIVESEGWVVEQCTGLKDASGKLIYEGDILLLDPDDPPALVVWSEDVAMFCLEQEDVCYTFDNCGYSPQEMEVIGNIHENPELLEDK